MESDRIDFISSYCDRWCERCAFTSRCSAYACDVAIAMCGSVAEGIELAVGRPHPVDPQQGQQVRDWRADLPNGRMSPEEEAEYERERKARDRRIEASAISRLAWTFMEAAHEWLLERGDALRASADPVLAEAIEIASHDWSFITVKLHRALDGRDRHDHGSEFDDDHPTQNDWNGSAKIALLVIERSEAAWRVIAVAAQDSRASGIGEMLATLQRLALERFPHAMAFIRPGFDEPWR